MASTQAPGVTIFSPAQLDEVINQTIPQNLPAGHKNAIVATVDTNGAKVAALFALGDSGHWQVKAAGEYDWNGDKKAGAELIDSW